jgi:hypothetical protein
MINSDFSPHDPPGEQAIATAASAGGRGALALAGLATVIVLALWLAFYLLVFVPRATAP